MVNSNNKTIKRAALIGLGTIFLEYKEGLVATDKFNLVALMDISEEARGLDMFPELPFYTSFDDLLKNEEIDLVIISTPPSSHYELIKTALEAKKDVIVEKPMLLNIDKIKELYALANSLNLTLNTAYHWQNGEEVKQFNKTYDAKKIEEISIMVDDPYSDDGVNISDNKKHLEGCWIDSGVNALSLIKTWLPFNETIVENVEIVFANNIHQPIYSKVELMIDKVKVSIRVDWRNNKNSKKSYLIYDGKRIEINHSEQSIVGIDKTALFNSMNRLSRHYYNYFSYFDYSTNYEETIKIHDVLLKVRDLYEKKSN